jgi:hypothetical protein
MDETKIKPRETTMNQTNLSKVSRTFRLLLLIAVIASAAVAGTAYAKYDEGADVTVSVTRLKGLHVGILIEFPNALTGNYGLVVNGKTFDCEQVSETTLYCTGPLRPGEGGTLNVHSSDGTTMIFSAVVSGPPSNEPECEGDECDPPEPECEGRDCKDEKPKCIGPDCGKEKPQCIGPECGKQDRPFICWGDGLFCPCPPQDQFCHKN